MTDGVPSKPMAETGVLFGPFPEKVLRNHDRQCASGPFSWDRRALLTLLQIAKKKMTDGVPWKPLGGTEWPFGSIIKKFREKVSNKVPSKIEDYLGGGGRKEE